MSLFADFDHYNTPLGADGTPYSYWRALRDEAVASGKALHRSEAHGGFWVVARWALSRQVHQNTTTFSNRRVTHPPYGMPGGRPAMLSGMDAPQHIYYRRMVQGPFNPQAADAREQQIRDIANDLIDELIESGRADLCTATDLLPERAAAAILGLPVSEGPRYRRFVHAMVQHASDPAGAAPALKEMEEYWVDKARQYRAQPAPGLLSEIVNASFDGKSLNDEELYDFFGNLLLGGLDNTARFIGNVLWRLATTPALRDELVAHPERVPVALEEFLRLDGPAMVFREVKVANEIEGHRLAPGDIVGLIHPITNRDPDVFPDPDAFVIGREGNKHFAMGHGVHTCLGLHLMRVEVRVILQELLRRMPDFAADPERRPRWVAGQVGAMHEVPVVFTPGRRERRSN